MSLQLPLPLAARCAPFNCSHDYFLLSNSARFFQVSISFLQSIAMAAEETKRMIVPPVSAAAPAAVSDTASQAHAFLDTAVAATSAVAASLQLVDSITGADVAARSGPPPRSILLSDINSDTRSASQGDSMGSNSTWLQMLQILHAQHRQHVHHRTGAPLPLLCCEPGACVTRLGRIDIPAARHCDQLRRWREKQPYQRPKHHGT